MGVFVRGLGHGPTLSRCGSRCPEQRLAGFPSHFRAGAGRRFHRDLSWNAGPMPARFRAVVENSPNAIKYNCTGGTVIIDCQKTPDEMLRVGVADIGYDSSKWRDQLLRPFSRLAGKNTNIEGTGLGLLICKQLIEAVGGRDRVREQDVPGVHVLGWPTRSREATFWEGPTLAKENSHRPIRGGWADQQATHANHPVPSSRTLPCLWLMAPSAAFVSP